MLRINKCKLALSSVRRYFADALGNKKDPNINKMSKTGDKQVLEDLYKPDPRNNETDYNRRIEDSDEVKGRNLGSTTQQPFGSSKEAFGAGAKIDFNQKGSVSSIDRNATEDLTKSNEFGKDNLRDQDRDLAANRAGTSSKMILNNTDNNTMETNTSGNRKI